jgi:hypothetical protein
MLFTITGLFSTWQPLMQSFYLAASMAGSGPNRGVPDELSPYFPTHSAKRNGAVYYVPPVFGFSQYLCGKPKSGLQPEPTTGC